MKQVLNEWNSTNNYPTRVSNLRNGGGLNGANKLHATTVLADTSADILYGGLGLDWFFAQLPPDLIKGTSPRRR